MRKKVLIVVLSLVAIMAVNRMAAAEHSQGATDGSNNSSFYEQADPIQQQTYANRAASGGCAACHGYQDVTSLTTQEYGTSGPHGGYTTTSGKCVTCHAIHSNSYGNDVRIAVNTKLLPGNTVTRVCNFCHDLTGTPNAPYSTRYLGISSIDVKSGHFVEGAEPEAGISSIRSADPYLTTSSNVYQNLNMPGMESGPDGPLGDVIPGADPVSGGTLIIDENTFDQGSLATAFGGTKFFTCDSCHSPHGMSNKVVNEYWGETDRTGVATSRLLKRKPLIGGNTATIYGTSWCASCHQERLTMTVNGNYNHPVNLAGPAYLTTTVLNNAGAYAHVVNGKDADGSGTFGDSDRDLAKTNAWYAMDSIDPLTNVDRTTGTDALGKHLDGYIDIRAFARPTTMTGGIAAQDGVSCQQCHANPRDVESSFTDDKKVIVSTETYTGNPFTTFPHVSRHKSLLVEDGNDLCNNCHGLNLD